MQVSVTTSSQDGVFVLSFGGDIDVASAVTVRDALDRVIAAGHHRLVLDLGDVQFLDSTGLGVLVGGLKKVRAHDGSLSLVCGQDRLLRIFRITGLAKVFAIHPDAETAFAS